MFTEMNKDRQTVSQTNIGDYYKPDEVNPGSKILLFFPDPFPTSKVAQ